jgi:hypothetical protein
MASKLVLKIKGVRTDVKINENDLIVISIKIRKQKQKSDCFI